MTKQKKERYLESREISKFEVNATVIYILFGIFSLYLNSFISKL